LFDERSERRPKFSGPPGGNATAAPTAIGSGGKAKQPGNNRSYRRPPPTSRWHNLDYVTAALLRERLGGVR
jgi:hypothetical protein